MTSLDTLGYKVLPFQKRVIKYVGRQYTLEDRPTQSHMRSMELLIDQLTNYRPIAMCTKCQESLPDGYWIRTHIWAKDKNGVDKKEEDHSRQVFCEDCAGDDRYTKYIPIDGDDIELGFNFNRKHELKEKKKPKGPSYTFKLQKPIDNLENEIPKTTITQM